MRYSKQLVVSAFLFLCAAHFVTPVNANPTDGYQGCIYIGADNRKHTVNQTFTNVLWYAGQATYCPENHTTSAGRQFDHAHLPHGFPFLDSIRNETVSSAMADAGYNAEFKGWELQDNATFHGNCHSHTFGYQNTISSSTNGSSRVKKDEGYTVKLTKPEADCIEFKESHSQKITAVDCDPPKVKTRSKKDNSSGIYMITYKDPEKEGAKTNGANMWKKK